ncbi:helix-turn-helix transcriptional regulator [Mycolicibacterium arseniciresistens]|uniref:Helix-turn-helix transcriptional regulator n=1 Tax=Mycolicibacterium arseniciresistens TaxID=3062257 RepID=A0ABT8UML7_9MYCO|nr:helix-turn-helix transcriptional regulator [Mycolicibacterium arseniciresistens]MDO3637424.1 helix-turn-helix transcriptional regulator [Mycolicibacterium arseniciresistens]
MDQGQLADFLRTRRAALSPQELGLAAGRRRRTTGLRREEVAALAMISTDYYTRMEQRRAPQPSTDVLASLARALRLSLDERDHLFRLAGHNAPARTLGGEHVSAATMRILDRLQDTPAQVMSALGETLVQTPAARALLGDETAFEGMARSVVYRWFTDERARQVYPSEDHAMIGRRFVADARVAYARDGAGSRAAQIVEALLDRSAAFTELWKRHDVSTTREQTKRIAHPKLGVLDVQCQILYDAAQLHTLLVFTADPGSASHAKLAALGADPDAYSRGDRREPALLNGGSPITG